MYSPEVIVNVVSAAIYCLVLPPCMDVFLLKLCCPLAIQNCHPAEYHHIVLLEFMCVESFSAVFLLKKKNPSPQKTRRKGRNLVIQTATKGKASSLARQGLGLNSLRPTENETTWAVGGPSYGPPREASLLARITS